MERELIICIVNEGFSSIVMAAAKNKGARGGTVFNARGTGNKELEKFHGIVIKPEKEVVLIVVDRELRDNIMHEIYEMVGMETPGEGICFALPVSNVLGLKDYNFKEE